MTRSVERALRSVRIVSIAGLWGLACGEGSTVNMGTLVLPGSTGSGGSTCSTTSCTGSSVFVQPSAMGAPLDAFENGTQHPPGSEPNSEPLLLYPSDETMLPANASRVRYAWSLAGRSALFALDFVGPRASVRIVTRDTSFTPSPGEWTAISDQNRGEQVDLVVRAVLDGEPDDVWESRRVSLFLSATPLDGTAYYWATGGGGLMRARLNDARAVRYFTDPVGTDAATCTGCHTLSRDGQRLAVGYDKNKIAIVSRPDRTTLVPAGSVGLDPMGMVPPQVWSTFSPDGRLLLTSGGGKLRLVDAELGTPVGPGQGEVKLPTGTNATHPDWSPLNDLVAVTLGKGGDKQTDEGSIAVLPYDGMTFGDPRIIVASTGKGDNNVFPSVSPDGRFVAYVNATGGSQDAPSARLRLIELATGAVQELTRLNERVGTEDGLLDLGNTMPTWAPSPPNGPFWLSFSSLRAYADVRPPSIKQDQLWLAAIDPALDDPGYAAFWAPFQNLGQGNHRAQWAPGTESTCGCVEECGDGVDNDCDGTVDEADCATCAERETCDNGVDDDCDCIVDDCSEEICGDGIDNDGDGKDDKMDLVCKGT